MYFAQHHDFLVSQKEIYPTQLVDETLLVEICGPFSRGLALKQFRNFGHARLGELSSSASSFSFSSSSSSSFVVVVVVVVAVVVVILVVVLVACVVAVAVAVVVAVIVAAIVVVGEVVVFEDSFDIFSSPS